MSLRTAEEMAWSDFLDSALSSEVFIREFEQHCGKKMPKLDEPALSEDETWELFKQYREWLFAFRDWVTERWGRQFAPEWLQAERPN